MCRGRLKSTKHYLFFHKNSKQVLSTAHEMLLDAR